MGIIAASCVAIIVFILPGTFFVRATGLPWTWSLLSAVPVTAALWQILAVLYSMANIRFNTSSVIFGTLILIGLGLLWGILWRRYSSRSRSNQTFTSSAKKRYFSLLMLPIVGVTTAIGIFITYTNQALNKVSNGMENVFQGWDVLWHASVVRYISESGTGSPLDMGAVQNLETQDPLFYPTGWHTMVAMVQEISGLSTLASVNISAGIMPAIVLPLCGLALGWRVVGKRSRTAVLVSTFSALTMTLPLVLFFVGYYVGAWPYLVAIGMVGIIFFLFSALPNRHEALLVVALALIGACSIHPSMISVLLILLILWWLTYYLIFAKGGWKAKLQGTAYIAGAGVLAMLYLLPQWLAIRSQTEDISAFNNVLDLTHSEAFEKAITLQTRHATQYGTDWVFIILAVVGLVLALFWFKNIWSILSAGFFLLLVAHSFVNYSGTLGSFMSSIIGLHYSVAHRLVLPLAMLMAVGVAVTLAAVVSLIFLAVKKTSYTDLTFFVSGVLTITLLGLVSLLYNYGPKMELLEGSRHDRLVDQDEIDSYAWLAQQPRAYDGVIANSPNEGSGWMYPLEGIPALHKHYLWPRLEQNTETNRIFWDLKYIGAGLGPAPGETERRLENANLADFSLKKMNVSYYVSSPPTFWMDDPLMIPEIGDTWWVPGVTPVWHKGNTYIFVVNANFSDDMIEKMRAQSPDPLPDDPLTWADVGLVDSSDPKADRPYYHRPRIWDASQIDFDPPVLDSYKDSQKIPNRFGSDG